MFTKQKFINIISFILILGVNLLFFLKYTVIYTSQPVVFTITYALIFTGIIVFAGNIREPKFITKKTISAAALVISILVLVYIISVPRIGEIGRLPAIEDWISRFQNGLYPYNSPHTPSSFPGTFFIAYPFYLIGNTGLLELLGTLIFMLIIFYREDTNKGKAVNILIYLGSTITAYEIATRSELFFNMMLVSGTAFLCEKYLKPRKINTAFILLALLTGLVLSTRSVAAFLFVIYFLYRFRSELRYLILFGTMSLIVIAAFLIPMFFWDPASFMKNGPFAVQSYLSNLPAIIIIIILLAAVYGGWIIADLQEFFFSGGVILFFAASTSFIIKSISTGFYESLINDGYDIAYFIFCVPLLLLAIKDYSTDKYLGKLYS